MAIRYSFVVTGANCGIGFEAAKSLAIAGYQVVMACRSLERGNKAKDQLIKTLCSSPNCFDGEVVSKQLVVKHLDVSKMRSVFEFVNDLKSSEIDPLIGLVNNAGIGGKADNKVVHRVETSGFEVIMATNHFGSALLSLLLLDTFSTPAEESTNENLINKPIILNITSRLHDHVKYPFHGRVKAGPTNLDDLNYAENDQHYSDIQAYKDSKLSMILFGTHLYRRLQSSGREILVRSLCPGFIPASNFLRDLGACQRGMIRCFVGCILPIFGKKVAAPLESAGPAVMYSVKFKNEEKFDVEQGRVGFEYFTNDGFDKVQLSVSSDESLNVENEEKCFRKTVELIRSTLDYHQRNFFDGLLEKYSLVG